MSADDEEFLSIVRRILSENRDYFVYIGSEKMLKIA